MIERLISFADADANVYGTVALGGDGEGNGSLAAGFLGDEGTSLAIDRAAATRGDGSLRIDAGWGELVLGLSAQTSPLAFETGPGRSVSIQAIGASLETKGRAAGTLAGGFEATGVAWQIEGEGDQASLRTAWAELDDASLLALFTLRPAGADDHGAETVGAARIGKGGAVSAYDEPLLSTEYDADGAQTRATLELWSGEDDGLPTRGAGRRAFGGRGRAAGGVIEAARFEWSVDGVPGHGGYEIFSSGA